MKRIINADRKPDMIPCDVCNGLCSRYYVRTADKVDCTRCSNTGWIPEPPREPDTKWKSMEIKCRNYDNDRLRVESYYGDIWFEHKSPNQDVSTEMLISHYDAERLITFLQDILKK